ncbi:MAG TPA: creatininase family protein [Beijerinckiaceae bacterium]|nr:creatininase family protein [Beijerinckiaceae bacterium]
MRLDTLKWPEIAAVSDRVFLVPLGSTEQHGRHLPLQTDTAIVSAIAERVERAAPDRIVLLPALWIGHSPHHAAFGCISLDVRPYMDLIAGICRSLVGMGARRIVLLNGHGGNDVPCKAAMRELKTEFATRADLYIVYAAYWALAARRFSDIRKSPVGGMNHACEMETSVMLSVAPGSVDMSRAEAGGPCHETGWRRSDMLQPRPYYIVNDFDEISESGTVGLPEYASAAQGEQFLSAAAASVEELLAEVMTWNYQG